MEFINCCDDCENKGILECEHFPSIDDYNNLWLGGTEKGTKKGDDKRLAISILSKKQKREPTKCAAKCVKFVCKRNGKEADYCKKHCCIKAFDGGECLQKLLNGKKSLLCPLHEKSSEPETEHQSLDGFPLAHLISDDDDFGNVPQEIKDAINNDIDISELNIDAWADLIPL
jgi:hypothetical protein